MTTLNRGGWGPTEGVLVAVSSLTSSLYDVGFFPFILLAKFLPSTVVGEGVSYGSSPPTCTRAGIAASDFLAVRS